jgi:hypothetical protein
MTAQENCGWTVCPTQITIYVFLEWVAGAPREPVQLQHASRTYPRCGELRACVSRLSCNTTIPGICIYTPRFIGPRPSLPCALAMGDPVPRKQAPNLPGGHASIGAYANNPPMPPSTFPR